MAEAAGDRVVVASAIACDHGGVTMPAADDVAPKEPRRVRVMLQVPPNVEHPENVDLALAVEILNSPELAEEIWAANNYDPDLEA